MATTTIPWGDGSGDNIYLTYPSASGNQTVVVTSDANTGSVERTKVVTFSASANGQTVTKTLTLIQERVAEQYIVFADSVVEQICATNWGDGVGLKPSQAALVTNSQLGTTFYNNKDITSFNEFVYFTSITQPSNNAFRNCSALTSITFPPSLTTIGSYNFADSGLAGTFEIPSTVTKINNRNGFAGCKFTKVIIPSTMTDIGNYAFYTCRSLATVVVNATTPPTLGTDVFRTNASGRKIYVPYSSDHSILSAYKAASKWSGYANDIYELNQDGTIPS